MEINKQLNYKELCKELHDKEVQGGRNKKLQFERWGEQYDIEKIGRGKYIIHKQYTEEEIANIKAEKNYSNFVEAGILNYIANTENVVTVCTYTNLREGLSMINKNYSKYKYCLEELELQTNAFTPELLEQFELTWFRIADQHDKYVIRSALERARKRGLIDYTESYVFYNLVPGPNHSTIWSAPVYASDEQKAQLEQVKVDFMKEHKLNSVQDIYRHGETMVGKYYHAVDKKVKELGYDKYARSFVISRPSDFKRVVNFFAPKFNKAQVDRLLKSKRFKIIPPVIHEQLIDKAIKLSE